MGYDLSLFTGDVDEELLCPICKGALEKPVQFSDCQHAFCENCIRQCLSAMSCCPIDRLPVTTEQLVPAPRVMKNLLNKLLMTCQFNSKGCTVVIRLEEFDSHVKQCQFNPTVSVPCPSGCKIMVARENLKDHSCVTALRMIIDRQECDICEIRQELATVKSKMQCLSAELERVKSALQGAFLSLTQHHSLASLQSSRNPPSDAETSRILTRSRSQVESPSSTTGSNTDEAPAQPRLLNYSMDSFEIQTWLRSLSIAIVTRWGSMISTPDSGLKESISRALLDSGCPFFLMEQLMANSHENRWPPRLNCLDMRQINRPVYQQFKMRRIPGKQAVLLMAIENRHMGEDLIVTPGMVMVFAHGVE